MQFVKAFSIFCLIFVQSHLVSGSPTDRLFNLDRTRNDCGPCGWIHYRNRDRNNFLTDDITKNSL